MCRGATRMKRRLPNPRYDDHKTTLSNSNSQDPSTRTPKPRKVGDAQPVDMRRQTSTKNPSDRELTPGVLSGKWHPTPLTLAFGLEDRPTPSREDVRELKRRNGATFADSEGGCPRLSIISLLHPRTADRREAPALAAVVSQINRGRPHARLWSCLRTLSVFLAEKGLTA